MAAAGAGASATPATAPAQAPLQPPVIPLDIVDGPTQLRWSLAVAVCLQSAKVLHAVEHYSDSGARRFGFLTLYAALDAALVAFVHRLRIPRLSEIGRAHV